MVFGGDNGSTARNLSNDIYVFDLSKLRWTKIETTGDLPPPRSHFASAFVGGKFYVFGGSGKGEQEKLNDLYCLDLASIELLREVTFDEIKAEVEHTINFVMDEMGKMSREVGEKASSGKSSTEYRQARRVVDEKVWDTASLSLRCAHDSVGLAPGFICDDQNERAVRKASCGEGEVLRVEV